LFGDDIIDNDITAAEQLIQRFEEIERPVIASIQVSLHEAKNYGIIETQDGRVTKFIEKPKNGETHSTQAAI
jgi:UTP-glucose-1-phosphate uridylyltransferase